MRFLPVSGHNLATGLVVSIVIAAVSTGLGQLVPVIGGPVFGIVIGFAVAALLPRLAGESAERLGPGAAFVGRYVLQASIVLLGAGLSLRQVLHTGASSLPVLLGTLTVALLGALLAGRLLGVTGDTRTLIGVGTGICGASAIAAVTAVIDAAEADVAYAIATIFTFNVAAVLLYPSLGHVLGLTQHAFGLWSGTAINDTSSVVAAATIYGTAAAKYGVVVKLTRTLAIIPICVGIGAWRARRSTSAGSGSAGAGLRRLPWRAMFPLFLLGFLAASGLDSVGVIPAGWHPALATTSGLLITLALTGIGLSTRVARLRAVGVRPILLGGALWVAVGVTSLLLQLATGTA